MTFESEGLLVVAIYIRLPPASCVFRLSDDSGFYYIWPLVDPVQAKNARGAFSFGNSLE